MNNEIKEIDNETLFSGTNIFNPQAKVLANIDRVLEYLETGNASPVLVEVDPSNACNHGCHFCISNYIHLEESKGLKTFDRSIMPENVLMNLSKDFIEMGVRAINWTGGGEPTVNPALKEVITYIGKNSNIKMGMFTNGTLLDRHDLFDSLVNYMTWVRFSVDAGTAENYNKIRRVRKNQDWNKMISNLERLIKTNNRNGNKLDIGVGFVVTPDTYREIMDFAKTFSNFDIDYCQFKPEIVNREKEKGIQREVKFWNEEIQPRLLEAKEILGDKFQINGYKFDDLTSDPLMYGRNYKKCMGSQIQPSVGADGEVYVCVNHRGYKEYSYGSLFDKSFKNIWEDIVTRNKLMYQIDKVECFANCTKLCKSHESNKKVWEIYENLNSLNGEDKENYKKDLMKLGDSIREKLKHPEFI